MINIKKILTLIFLIIPLDISLSQSIKDVPKTFKKDFKEYLKSNGESDSKDSISTFQIDPSLYTKFRVPEFSYKKLKIGSDEILNYSKIGDESSFGLNIKGDYEYFKQSTYTTFSYSIKPTFASEDTSDQIQLEIPLDFSKYFNQNYSGLHGFTSTNIGVNDIELSGGVGYGRVTSVRPIARAVALASKVGNEMTNDDIIAIANIITKQNDGYYENKYKSDANIMYYNELSNALNAPTETMFIQQIMEDPAFGNISDRRTGWQVRAGYSYSEHEAQSYVVSGIVLSVDYAKPIGFDRQLLFEFETVGADDASITGSYTIDHSITWVSGCHLTFIAINNETNAEIKIESTKDLLNKISTTASLAFGEDYRGNSNINFYITFNYFAF